MQAERAQILSLQALAWLGGDEDMLVAFLQATGADTGELRARATEPVFQIAVLDFLMTNDAWVIAFCDAHAFAYTDPAAARAALPGGAIPHWT